MQKRDADVRRFFASLIQLLSVILRVIRRKNRKAIVQKMASIGVTTGTVNYGLYNTGKFPHIRYLHGKQCGLSDRPRIIAVLTIFTGIIGSKEEID